ncbi:hypothetical protein, partial [Cronobacter sakazakii]|uniref:hypothetical protein n=1 Tax=Cronobacter sakazakii TaxID=28141 RepID=UPI001F2A7C63
LVDKRDRDTALKPARLDHCGVLKISCELARLRNSAAACVACGWWISVIVIPLSSLRVWIIAAF